MVKNNTKKLMNQDESSKISTDITPNLDTLITTFKYCQNILRDNEHLIGEKAIRSLSQLLILRLIENKLGSNLDLLTYTGYDFSQYSKDDKTKVLSCIKFSNILKQKEEDIPTLMKILWDEVLSVHPKTKDIYIKDKNFDIKQGSTYKKLVDKLSKYPFEQSTLDIQGAAYEEIIKNNAIGVGFGQFFTQPEIKDIMIDIINPKVKKDGTTETIFDLAMGTGGFLTSSIKHIIKQATKQKIKLDWNFISTSGIGGREVEPDTFQLAKTNLFISSNHLFTSIQQEDSIRNPITTKYDIVLANPPFGIKGLQYDEIKHILKDQYIPIRTNHAVPLFIQAIIYILKKNGRCAVVLPDGQDLYGTSKDKINVREYLLKTCDLKEIILLPPGIFGYTTIKTCVFYFHKKKECNEVIECKSVSNRNSNKTYIFVKEHQTSTVKFIEYNSATKSKKLIIEVPIDKIAKNNYSLNYTEYIEVKQVVYDKTITVKTMGEVCEFLNGYAFKSSEFQEKTDKTIGIIQIKSLHSQFISSETITKFVIKNSKFKNFEINYGDILIGLSGSVGKIGMYQLNYTSYLNQRVAKIICNKINPKYFYHWYINSNMESTLLNLANGTAQPNISTNDISKIKIPIPSLEVQTYVVKYLDFLYDKCIKTSTDKIAELKQSNKYRLENHKKYGYNEIKQLGDVCDIQIGGTPSRNNLSYYTNGTNLWISVKELNGGFITDTKEKITDLGVQNSNVKLYKKDTILFSFKLSIGKTAIVGKPLYSNEAIAGINSNDLKILDNMYLYHYLRNTNYSQIGSGILGNGSLNKVSLAAIEIPIPSIEKQKEIVAYCETNDALIISLEKDIETNKQLAKDFLNDIIKPTNKPKKSKKSADKKPTDKSTLDDNQTDELSDLDTDELELLETKADKKAATKPKKNRLKNINIIKN